MPPKPLYLGSSIKELQKLADLGNFPASFKCKSLHSSSEKLLKEATHQSDLGDEEKAYVLYMKYFNVIQKIVAHKEYKEDRKYWDTVVKINKNTKTVIEQLEVLDEKLEKRYSDKDLEKVKKKLAETSITNGDVNGNTNVATDLNDKTDKDKLESDTKSSEKKTEDQSYHVTSNKLYSLIKEKCTSFFILDTRPTPDYQTSHVKHPTSINVPEAILSPGATARTIAKNLTIESRDQWSRRANIDMLIICDWSSEDFSPNAPVTVLRDALAKWDVETTYKNPPFLLKGGYERFLLSYPHFVTNPRARAPQVEKDSQLEIPSLDFEYPDLDNAFMITPSPSPKVPNPAIASGAITISRSEVVTPKSASSQPALPKVDRSTKPTDSNSSVTRKTEESRSSLWSKDTFNDDQRESAMFLTNGPSKLSSVSPGVNSVFNNARFSDVGEVSQQSQLNSGSQLNNARISGVSGVSQLNNARVSDSSDNNSTGGSTLNNAVIEGDRKGKAPSVDRSMKEQAVLRYSRGNVTNVDDVLKAEEELMENSMTREKKHLEMEKEWEIMRLRKEKEHEENMGEIIRADQEELWKEMDALREENKKKDEEDVRLRKELEMVRKELEKRDNLKEKQERMQKEKEAEERIKEKEEEHRRLKQEVELKRQKRKEEEQKKERERKEREQKRREEEKLKLEQQDKERRRREAEEDREISVARLKDDGGGGGGGMKKSFSSPNIAQMLDQEDRAAKSRAPAPKFNREVKPAAIQPRNFAGVWGTGKPGLTGLKNMGNTCYMNSVLQCVSNTAPLANYFVTGAFEPDLNPRGETRGQVAKEFAEVLIRLWSAQFKSISPTDLKRTIGRLKREFAGADQQDAHEFIITLFDWLHKETNKVQRPTPEPEQKNDHIPDYHAAANHWKEFLIRNQSIFVQLFHGQRRSMVKCLSCGTESVTYDVFSVLTLPIPAVSSRVSIHDCFQEYLKEEVVDEWKCTFCKVNRKSIKKIDIVKFPPVLVIHLNRFYNDGLWRKKQNYVNFELNSLDLSRYALAMQTHNTRYFNFNLYGVSNHYGTMEGGHYTAYCKSDIYGTWYKYDDQVVSQMDSQDVKSSAAYIMFYTAIEDLNTLPPLG